MKKALFFLFVLGFAVSADAALIFTVNGEPQPNEVTIVTSETIELGIDLEEGHSSQGYHLEYILSNSQAEFLYDSVEFPAPFDCPGTFFYAWPQSCEMIANYEDFIGQFPAGPPISGPQVLMQGLLISCLEPTDVILEIYAASYGVIVDGEHIPAGTLMHTLTIRQIPEPMTLTLLGLGGLFLIRRRKI